MTEENKSNGVLLPCPQCGGEPTQWTIACGWLDNGEVEEDFAIRCSGCGYEVIGCCRRNAVETWNRRGEVKS